MLLLNKFITLIMLVSLSVKFTTEQKSVRVFGGVSRSIAYYPFIVSLKDNKNMHFCGGSIINNDTILTAAHCAIVPFQNLVAGATYKNDYGYVHTVRWIKVHEGYNQINDIALVKVNEAFVFGQSVAPIQLNIVKSIPHGTAAVAIGWGMRTENNEEFLANYALQVTFTRIISNEQCRRYVLGPVADADICVQDIYTGHGVCKGDSGGPLVINNLLVGITSKGYQCGNGLPSVFTAVAHYLDWIHYYL